MQRYNKRKNISRLLVYFTCLRGVTVSISTSKLIIKRQLNLEVSVNRFICTKLINKSVDAMKPLVLYNV